MTKFSDMPDEVKMEIMSWLPPESLIRSKCVKKSWKILINGLIKNPIFVGKHLNNSKKKALPLILKGLAFIVPDDKNKKRELGSVIIKDFSPLFLMQNDGLVEGFWNGISRCNGISHCNGIVCLICFFGCRILLYNPATNESKHLPDPVLPKVAVIGTIKVGFGFDYISKVYKVVRVFTDFWNIKAQVYTLGHDGWRDIEFGQEEIMSPCQRCIINHVYCKGFYYWLVRTDQTLTNKKTRIHSFDMHNEEFHTISLPDIAQSPEYSSVYHTRLAEWKDFAALFSFPKAEWVKQKPIEMWVMHLPFEGHKNSPCWIKHLSIGPNGIHMIPKAFLDSEELLIEVFEHVIRKSLFSYNLRTSKIRQIHKDNVRWFEAFYYVKSLVSVNGNTFDI